jgi:pyruvate/2-oxoglutarate dehydrogenase complex dihydrolipoamide acyltransferase (E2) component
MPQLGEGVAEGTIGRWLRQPGDRVEKDEPLVEVITDKVNAEVPSPFAGTLTAILADEGATVPTEAPIAEIEAEQPDGAAPVPSADPAPATPEAASRAQEPPRVPVGGSPGPATSTVPAARETVGGAPDASRGVPLPAIGDPDARMTPAVRRLLRERGLTADQVPGSGGGGRITRQDVLTVADARHRGGIAPAAAVVPTAAPAPSPNGGTVAFPPGVDEVLVPVTRMRKGIAAQMTRALQVPHAYVHMEVDVTGLVRLRESIKRDYLAREGTSLSFVPFVVKAAVEALRRHPTFNAAWTEQGLMAKRRVNMGIAVAVDDGLIVPVVRDVDQLSISGINHAIADVAARARAQRLRVDDFGGGTFTIDNTGWFGSNLTLPIINVPEVAILTMEAITKRPVVVETPQGDTIAIRPIMNMVVGIDHRANDGAQAGFFLRDVKAWLEGIGPDTAVF